MSVRFHLPPSTSTSIPSSPLRVTPCSRSFSQAPAMPASGSTSAPPSPVVTFLLAWKLKATKSPAAPIGRPRQLAPKDCAASSTTRSPCSRARAPRRSRSTGSPARSTGMIARVAPVTACAARSRSMLRVRGSTSTNTGRAPTSSTTFAVATQDSGVVITSSPGPTPARRRPTSSAAVPEQRVRTTRPPQWRESAASKAFTCGPEVIQPERRTSATPAIVASSMDGRVNGSRLIRCARRGTRLRR
jgi:hypothetical protein